MTDKQTNLHPKNDSGTNLKPNIISENIPADSITYEKLSEVLKDQYDRTMLDDHSDISTIDSQLRNADDAVCDRIYTINATDNTGFTNYPDRAIDQFRDLLITLKSNYQNGLVYVQYFINATDVYQRSKIGDAQWTVWKMRPFGRKVFYVSDGNVSTLINTINDAVKLKGSTVFVDGTYDLNAYGFNADILLGNDIKIIGSSRSLITYYYTGSDSNIQMNVSPFRKLENGGGFTLENITIKCKNVRYCVHDEDWGANDVYNNYYRNCFFEMDNTENPVWKDSQTIGGGLGTNGHIVIENSKFISRGDLARTKGDVSYHNSPVSYGKSHITVTGCYFANTFTARWYGTSTEMTEVLLSNNSFAVAPKSEPNDEDGKTENMQLIAFNNSIRE